VTTPPIGGDVKFSCDFENGWEACGLYEQAKVIGQRATLVSTSRAGTKAVQLRTQEGDSSVNGSGSWERNDLSLGPQAGYCNNGQAEWWAHSVRFPDEYKVPSQGGVVMDFHHTGSTGNANFHFNAMPTGLRIHGFGGNPSSPSEYKVELGAVQRNVWYDMVYNIKWSTGTDGYAHAWMNGKKVLTYSGPTLYPNMGCYLKLANYHDPVGGPSAIIHDRVVRGTTAASVAIGPLEGVQ
jgi:hypothetical protein